MEKEQIKILVKSLEKYFFGYKATETSLKNDSGLELYFFEDWNKKTKIRGIGGGHRHEIGCSFVKYQEKIVKDIRRRLLPAYRDDFFQAKKDQKKRKEQEEKRRLMLEAIALECSGEIRENHGYGRERLVSAENLTVKEYYNGNYKLSLELPFSDVIKLLKELKNEKLTSTTNLGTII